MFRGRTVAKAAATFLILLFPLSATSAQDSSDGEKKKEPKRYRVGLGAQFVPSFPGSEDFSIRPFGDFSRTRGDKPFAFEAPDENFGFAVVKAGALRIGPALNIEGSRKPSDIGAALDKVDTTFEAGAFVEYQLTPNFRTRSEVRKGLGGHDGWIGNVSADFIMRDGDRYLFSIGPRVTISNRTYHRAYFGVTPGESVATGLATYDPDGGVQAIGATTGLLFGIGPNWGIYSYAKYDRLVGDAARSPVVRQLGSRDQFSGGLALTYSWGGRRNR